MKLSTRLWGILNRQTSGRKTALASTVCSIAAGCLLLHSAALLSQTAGREQQASGAALTSMAETARPTMTNPPLLILFRSNSILIQAEGASLSAILHQVCAASGMEVQGLGDDEEVFGKFGPGEPQEVLSALLNGSHYNVVMIGRLDDGAPRMLLLSGRKDTVAQAPTQPTPAPAPEEAAAVENLPGPVAPENAPLPSGDTATPRQKTPEETLKELQAMAAEH